MPTWFLGLSTEFNWIHSQDSMTFPLTALKIPPPFIHSFSCIFVSLLKWATPVCGKTRIRITHCQSCGWTSTRSILSLQSNFPIHNTPFQHSLGPLTPNTHYLNLPANLVLCGTQSFLQPFKFPHWCEKSCISSQIWDSFWRALFGQSQHKFGRGKKDKLWPGLCSIPFKHQLYKGFMILNTEQYCIFYNIFFRKTKAKELPLPLALISVH